MQKRIPRDPFFRLRKAVWHGAPADHTTTGSGSSLTP